MTMTDNIQQLYALSHQVAQEVRHTYGLYTGDAQLGEEQTLIRLIDHTIALADLLSETIEALAERGE